MPLDSINADNVLIRGSRVGGMGRRDTIDFAWIMSSLGERPAVGSVSARLFAMGLILYELFSAEEKPPMEDMPSSNARFCRNSIDLTADKESNNDMTTVRPHKKSQQQATHTSGIRYPTVWPCSRGKAYLGPYVTS